MVKALLLYVILFALSAHAFDKRFDVNVCKKSLALLIQKHHSAWPHEIKVRMVDKLYEKHKTELEASITASWKNDQFTNPFSPSEKYKYLVLPLEEKIENEKLFQNPDSMNDIISLTATVITPEKSVIPAYSGYILESNFENVLATSTGDGGQPVQNEKDLAKRIQIFGIRSAKSLLEKTAPNRYNKVDIAGTATTGVPLRALGIFVKLSEENEPLVSQERLSHLRALAEEKSLPLVLIK